MQKTHKLLEDHRPQKLKTKPLMFETLRHRITNHGQQIQQMTPQQFVHKQKEHETGFFKLSNPQKCMQESSHKRTDSNSSNMMKRLKLKDYLRLNEISRQKRSLSARSLKMQSSQKLSLKPDFDPRSTFGPQGTISKKTTKKQAYSEEISLQRTQLVQTITKAQQRMKKVFDLINDTKDHFTSYTDLVFMFRVEEIINQQILKGIDSIKQSYKQHFIEKDHAGVEKITMMTALEAITPSKDTFRKNQAIKTESKLERISSREPQTSEKSQKHSHFPISVTFSPNVNPFKQFD